MDINKIRHSMLVTEFCSHNTGATIYYKRFGKTNALDLTKEELLKELISIGSLEENVTENEYAEYEISQWDAFNIATRFESGRDMDKDMERSDIFKALANIINPNTIK